MYYNVVLVLLGIVIGSEAPPLEKSRYNGNTLTNIKVPLLVQSLAYNLTGDSRGGGKDGRNAQVDTGFRPKQLYEQIRGDEFSCVLEIFQEAQLADKILQAKFEQHEKETIDRRNYWLNIKESGVSTLNFDDGAFPNDTEVLPGIIMAGISDEQNSTCHEDDTVEISLMIFASLSDIRDPVFGLLQQVFDDNKGVKQHPMRDEHNDMKVNSSYTGHLHSENAQVGKLDIQQPDLTAQPWFSHIPPYLHMLFTVLSSKESLVLQIHKFTRVFYIYPYCEHHDKLYVFGDVIYTPELQHCMECKCGTGWNSDGYKACKKKVCMWDIYRDVYNKQGCSPRYHRLQCCPDVLCP